MATEEKKEDLSKKDEDINLELNFIKENENENQSSVQNSKEGSIKLSDSSKASKKSKEEKSQNKANENSKVTREEKGSKRSSKKDNSINLLKKSSASKNNSSQQVNKRYSNNNENKSKEENKDKENDKDKDKDNKEFVNTGKFMQINPHFKIFNKQIDSLRDSIYDDTKRCLILKGSLQQSSNFLKEESNGLIKDIVEQIYNLRELFEKGNKGLNQTTNEVKESLKKLKDVQSKARKEIIECDKRINECENQIGYKLLGNPSYSFMKDKNGKKVEAQK